MRKKLLGIALLLLLCLMTGCAGKNEEAKTDTDDGAAPPESYQEDSLNLPFSAAEETFIGMTKNLSGEIQIYTREEASKCGNVYTLQEDKSFQKESLTAMDEFLRDASAPWTVSQGADGTVYFLYFDGEYIPHIVRMTEGNAEEAAGEQIAKQLESGDYPAAVLGAEDGSFLVAYMGNQAQYFDADGTLKSEIQIGSGQVNIRTDVALCGKSFFASNLAENKVIVYNLEDGKESNQIAMTPDEEFLILRPGSQDDFYMLNRAGLHHLTRDGKIVEICIDSSDMPTLIENTYPKAFETGKEDDCYVLYSNGEGGYLLKYYSRQQKNTDSAEEPQKSLKIIGIHESNTMKRAIVEFENVYPEVNVTFQSYEDIRKRGTLTETIRIINADILSGENGADIIVLDGLPQDSYVDKGALADLTEFAAGLTGDGALLGSLLSGSGEKVYSLPARFSVPILYGTDFAMDQLGSLDKILAFLENPGDTPLLEHVSYQLLAESLLAMNYDEIAADLPDASVIKKYMDAVTGLGAYVDASLDEVEDSSGEAEEYLLYLGTASCLGRDKAALSEIKTLTDLAEPFAFKREYGLDIRLVNGLYIPYDSVGISTTSQNTEEAENFLKILLSYTIQSIGMGEGLPVNEKAFQEMTKVNSDSEVSAGWEEDGQEVQMTFANLTQEEEATFKEMVRGAEKPLRMDSNVRELLLDGVKRVYQGETDSESAAADASQKLKLYMAEN